MALITMYKSDGQTMTIEETSPIKAMLINQGWSTNPPSNSNNNQTTPPANNNNQPATSSWNLSAWNASGNQWTQQPVLTINGQQFRFDRPDQYIDKMKSSGLTGGDYSRLISELQGVADWFYTPQSEVNAMYRKYFGRDATAAEMTEWRKPNSTVAALENKLKSDYKSASGIDYDGSPIKPGNQKTDNQLKTTTPVIPTPTPTPIPTPTSSYVYSSDKLNSKANDAAVNTLYQAYFGRDASAAELKNWGAQGGTDTTVKALEDFLKGERIKYNITTPIKTLDQITTPTTPTTPTTSNTYIPFRSGLTDAQKESITALTTKPVSQWSKTDKDNWNWATNNASLPTEEQATTPTTPEPTSLIPFRDGLSATQKSTIEALAQKPASEWSDTDILNWNWATNSAPRPTVTNETTNTYDPYEIASQLGYGREDFANDPGFEAYWKTKTPEELKAALMRRGDYDTTTGIKSTSTTGNKMLDDLLKQYQDYYDKQAAAGKILNPAVALEPSVIQQFLTEAETELNPYYKEQVDAIKEDISKNIEYLSKQYEYNKEKSISEFKDTLAGTREQAAGAGTIFSGTRGRSEQEAAQAATRSLNFAGDTFASQMGDIYRSGEKLAGTRTISDLGVRPVEYGALSQAGQGGYTSTRSAQDYFKPLESTGSLERERLTAVELSKQNKENLYRTRKAYEILNA